MKEITYTFIIPHKNNPDLLDRCLNSIPQHDDIQIIVVDDNSNEGKKPVESSRTEVEYIYIGKDESKGAGRARNKGLERAKGKWILFPDSDDFYNDGFIDILDKYKFSTYDIVYFNFEFRDGQTLDLLPDLPFKQYFDLYDGTQTYKDEIRFHHNVPWTKMVSRNYINEYNLYFEEVPNGNDILFSMMVGYFTNNIFVEKQGLYVYLRNDNSIVTSQNRSIESYLCKIRHIIKKNQFFILIGHKEWKLSLLSFVIYSIKECGLLLLYSILKEQISLFKSRKEWINLIEERTLDKR